MNECGIRNSSKTRRPQLGIVARLVKTPLLYKGNLNFHIIESLIEQGTFTLARLWFFIPFKGFSTYIPLPSLPSLHYFLFLSIL